MDLTSPKTIKELLLQHKTKPNKTLGQNFLIDKNVLEKIITASDIKNTDTIIEVGPGIGTLTQELAEKAKKVIAIEKDEALLKILEEILKNYNNIEIINGDVLKIENLGLKNYLPKADQPRAGKVVANIPYYLTSPLIRKFLESKNQPEEIILMIQKEVAQRICAKPPKMNLLAVSVQFYAEPKIISYVSKNCFWPSPKIDSAIIKITPKKSKISVAPELFFKIVKAGFAHPRKQLLGNLSKNLNLSKEKTADWLLQNNVDPKQRAETLSINDWGNLTNNYNK
jgi:16S rRNA (adenine1518-N6/adenine1519-N6)-dimethyltransferase